MCHTQAVKKLLFENENSYKDTLTDTNTLYCGSAEQAESFSQELPI